MKRIEIETGTKKTTVDFWDNGELDETIEIHDGRASIQENLFSVLKTTVRDTLIANRSSLFICEVSRKGKVVSRFLIAAEDEAEARTAIECENDERIVYKAEAIFKDNDVLTFREVDPRQSIVKI